MEILLLIFVVMTGLGVLGLFIYYSTRRGEVCPDYPHKCPWSRHADECIIEAGRKIK